MKRAAIYARVSSDRQAKEGDSIPAQVDALRKYVVEHGYILAGEYIDDGISGTKYDRDELQRLLEDLENIDVILFTKLDRWFRSVRHYTAVQERLDAAGVGWTAIWEPVYDTTTPAGRLIVNQMMSIAQFEAENTGQRIRQVFAYKAARGEVLSGNTPPGYSIKEKHLMPNSDADNVLTVFKTYARTGSLRRTCSECAGLSGIPGSEKQIKHMLQNRAYLGEMRGRPGCHPAIVPAGLFAEVGKLLKMNVRSSQKETYIFSGLVRCGSCGAALSAQTTRRKDANGKIYKYHCYRCQAHYSGPGRCSCSNGKVLYELTLEKYLLSQIRPDVEKIVLDYEIGAAAAADNSAKIAATEKKISRLKDLYLNEIISIEEYRADREKLEADLAGLHNTPPAPDFSALRAVLSVNIEEIYTGMDNAEKRRFWRGILKQITFREDRSIVLSY
jgi:DNA invertase Pin-like site-specific DNA recombinase